ncbi:uncharacterized protein LOC62_01G001234 [Vanrija pseudolonga]|uniref:Uncharacterized protein n=1 Tax=Vanrija pseudolonga TaxID=143232 RepID=A0AAF1BFL1_9TREE|nr:hypothetical protein LOC62_01G001234 [Vanrija pseudolonga]
MITTKRCWRITAAAAVRRHRFASSSAAHARPPEDDDPEPFGQAYGAGPSRLPYTPPPSASTTPSSRTTRDSARRIRLALDDVPRTQLGMPHQLLNALGISKSADALSRLEQHVILHHFIRRRRGVLAMELMMLWVQLYQLEAADHPSRPPQFSLVTLSILPTRVSGKPHPEFPVVDIPRSEKLPQPTFEEQQPDRVSNHLRVMLALIDRLQAVGHPRPMQLYSLAIEQALRERRFDMAAKTYALLVEAWVMEGRIAEGGRAEDFHQGGAPSRALTTTKSSALHKMWFSGVRTWRLPGEALSLHDRLDLWHPKSHAAGERLRGFPMPLPTSPPSLVPHPHRLLIEEILNSLMLDPHTASPAEFAASMRALATLANTILSRTLPIPAIPLLLSSFSKSHTHPAVYPDSISEEPASNAWAYTAHTQVHVALVSLIFSPPNFARAAELERESGVAVHQRQMNGPGRYMLPDLGLKSCVVLLTYAVHTLKQPRLITRLVSYVHDRWDFMRTTVTNMGFRGATLAQDNETAQKYDDVLFKGTLLDRHGDSNVDTSKWDKAVPVAVGPTAIATVSAPSGQPIKVTPDAHSLAALLSHLAATSQGERLKRAVYAVIPFLRVGRETTAHQIAILERDTGVVLGERGRPIPPELAGHVWAAMINALAKSGQFNLAQRIFFVALRNEYKQVCRHKLENEEMPDSLRLPIHIFTTMMDVYGSEGNSKPDMSIGQYPLRIKVDPKFHLYPRQIAAQAMVWQLYTDVRKRFAELDSDAPHLQLDARFFNSVIKATAPRFHLDSDTALDDDTAAELDEILRDIVDAGLECPPGLLSKLETGTSVGKKYLPIERTKGLQTKRTVPRRVYIPSRRALESEERAHVADPTQAAPQLAPTE